MDGEFEEQSSWNEQQGFSRLWFTSCAWCRAGQFNRDVEGWRRGLESKMSNVMGVCKEEEKIKINDIRKRVNYELAQFNTINDRQVRVKQKALNSLIDILFMAEADVDTVCNLHMPFLRIEKVLDIGNL